VLLCVQSVIQHECIHDAVDPGVCPEEDKERAKSNQYCGFLLSDSSPFKTCKDSKTVDFNKMYSSCEFDVCSSDEDDVHPLDQLRQHI
jgi:hypothetical protein